jgi:hypothetical protein
MIGNKKISFVLHLFYVQLSPDLDMRLMTLLCKKIIVAKSGELKTECNLAEFSKEGYGSKKGCFTSDDDPLTYATVAFPRLVS